MADDFFLDPICAALVEQARKYAASRSTLERFPEAAGSPEILVGAAIGAALIKSLTADERDMVRAALAESEGQAGNGG